MLLLIEGPAAATLPCLSPLSVRVLTPVNTCKCFYSLFRFSLSKISPIA